MARKQPARSLNFSKEMVQGTKDVAPVLDAYRKQSWKAFQDIPVPSNKDEDWRRTSLNGLDFRALDLPNGKLDQAGKDISTSSILNSVPDNLGSRVVIDHAGVEISADEALAEQGVVLSSLKEAAANHPDLVEKVLGKVVSPTEGHFAAAAGAFSRDGIFIYVPKGIEVKQPVIAVSNAPGQGTAYFFQTLIYLEEGSSLVYLQETLSDHGDDQPSLAGENLEIYVGPNANLKVTEIQNLGANVWSFGHKKAKVENDGNLEWEIGALGSTVCKHFVSLDLVGKGAEGRVYGLFFAERDQHLTYNTLQRHLAPRTTSDLLFKGALTGKSRSVWRGMIYVAPGAQYIDGYQANRNLVLDPAARSDSIPGLEILNNDVRCTHGSTVGKIDDEQLFYLLSRGIPRKEAEQLIIQGFYDDIISRFSIPEVGVELWKRIQNRLLS
jgi:Fe-S cluster assembly protein SufD